MPHVPNTDHTVPCRAKRPPGGVALVMPDFVTETFEPGTEAGGSDVGGSDVGGSGMRSLEWRWIPAGSRETRLTDFACLRREDSGTVEVIRDRIVMGLFPRAVWLELIADAGFDPITVPSEQDSCGDAGHEVFLGLRPEEGAAHG